MICIEVLKNLFRENVFSGTYLLPLTSLQGNRTRTSTYEWFPEQDRSSAL